MDIYVRPVSPVGPSPKEPATSHRLNLLTPPIFCDTNDTKELSCFLP